MRLPSPDPTAMRMCSCLCAASRARDGRSELTVVCSHLVHSSAREDFWEIVSVQIKFSTYKWMFMVVMTVETGCSFFAREPWRYTEFTAHTRRSSCGKSKTLAITSAFSVRGDCESGTLEVWSLLFVRLLCKTDLLRGRERLVWFFPAQFLTA